ncbi:hypothetical protein FRX31_033087 [Thalictrum thalictroides]|uniref:Uncharacterized protein n=1 Tax=Thalictrum thalictroides TaxID=46969 RepID=A0A7J6UXI9_THATH|nr:hypothetical protein FRX31_033087 [Thalictrum thalictroides]
MGGEEEEAVVAIVLGFPLYRRSLLKSKTYEAFVKFSSLFYQISPKSGKDSQGQEQACISDNSVEKELNNGIVTATATDFEFVGGLRSKGPTNNIGLNVVKDKKFEEWSSENLIRGSPQLDRRKNSGGITRDTLGHIGAASERVMAHIEENKASVKDIEVGVKRKSVVTKERKERKKV